MSSAVRRWLDYFRLTTRNSSAKRGYMTTKELIEQERIWKKRYGKTIMAHQGRVYIELPEGMLNVPQNRMPCPVCETNVVKYYYTMWANQHGSERRYWCDCRAVFQVRYDERGNWFTILPWKHDGKGANRNV